MKRIIIFSFLLFILQSQITLCEVVDRIVAIVNEDIITLKEVEQYIHVEKKEKLKSVDDHFLGLRIKERLDMLIENTLIKQEAKKMKIEVADTEVQQVVENIKKQNLITEEELKEQLARENMSYEEFLRGIRMALLRNKVLARVITPVMNLTEEKLIQYYSSRPEQFTQEELHLYQIFISGLRQDSQQIAKKAYELLREGMNFEEVAKIYSDDPSGEKGGDIGFVKKEELIPELKDALKDLKEGEYTQPIRTQYGFHILLLKERKKGEVLPFEEVKDEIKRKLIMEESEKRYKDYIEKLKKNSYIEVKL